MYRGRGAVVLRFCKLTMLGLVHCQWVYACVGVWSSLCGCVVKFACVCGCVVKFACVCGCVVKYACVNVC